jgi:hypothetical protein
MQTYTRLSGIAVLAAWLAFAPSASAQFGGLVNRAKDKLAQQAGEKVGPVAPGEQLSDDLLAKVITGATAADRMLSERDKVQNTREAKNKELSALSEKNAPIHQAYDQANDKIMSCRNSAFNTLQDARQEKYDAMVKERQSDPAFMGKMQLAAMKYGQRIAEAQQKNDPMALQKAQQEMMKEILGADVFADVKKDSVAVDSKCGKLPARPAALAQEEKLQKDINIADDSIRTLEAKAVNVGAQASGLEQLRYLQLKERAASILGRLSGKGAAVKYGDEEMAAVKKRQADLEKLIRAL